MKKSLKVNAILNGIKQACSVLFPLLSFVYCSRILGTENLGKYSFANSIINYFLLIAGLGISNYAIREGSEIRENINALSCFINEVFTINIISTLISYSLLAAVILAIPKLYLYKQLLIIQSIQIILTTVGADWINSIFEDYLYLAVRYIIIQALALVLLFLLVRSPNDIYIYIYALITVMSNSAGNLLNVFYIKKKKKISIKFAPLRDLKRHLGPIFVLFFNSIASVVYLNSDITMIGALTSDDMTGIYTVSSRIYSMTKTIINGVVMVTVPRFSFYISNNMKVKFNKSANSVLNALLLFSIPAALGMCIESREILLLIGGEKYISGSNSLKILSFAFVFAVLSCFNSYSILLPNHEERFFMITTMIAAIVNISLNFIFIPAYNIDGAAMTTLIAEFIVFVMTMFGCKKYFRLNQNLKSILLNIGLSCIVVFICNFNKTIISNSLLQLAISILECAAVYGGYILKAKPFKRND